MAEKKFSTSRYAIKFKQGVEVNHDRHPKEGIAWCSLCQGERRKFYRGTEKELTERLAKEKLGRSN